MNSARFLPAILLIQLVVDWSIIRPVSPSSAVAKTGILLANNLRILDPDFLHYIFNQF
jgi:hypothetical protein